MEIPGYTLMHRIGQGRFASLYLAKNSSGDIRAIKIIKSSLSEQELFRQEFKKHIEPLTTLNHKNCIKVYDAGIINKQCYIAMDYFPDGSIAPRLIFGFPVKQIIKIILDLINAVEYLKKSGLEHRNIQPRNIFIAKNNETVLSEYEVVSQILNDCPEIKFYDDKQLLKQMVDCQSDVNCLGLVFFKLLNRETTPYLEIPLQKLSGRRAVCWQPTMNKLFSNEHDESISDIFQLRNEIYRVQNEFKERINQDKNQSNLGSMQKRSNLKLVAKNGNSNVLQYKKSDLALLSTDQKQTELSLLLNEFDLESFLLAKKIPIMTSLTITTGFVIGLSLFTYFENKYDLSDLTHANNRPDILFPQQYTAVDKVTNELSIEKNSNTQLTEADLRQKERLKKIMQEQQAEKDRIAILEFQQEEKRLIALKLQLEEEQLIALEKQQKEELAVLKQKQEEERFAVLKKKQKEERLVVLKQKQEEARLIVLKQKKEELLISLQQKKEDDRLIALKLNNEKLLITQKKKIQQQQLALEQKNEQRRLATLKKKKVEEKRLIVLNKQKELKLKQKQLESKQLAELENQKILRQQRMDAARLQAEKEEFVLQYEQQQVIKKKIERTQTKPKFENFATF